MLDVVSLSQICFVIFPMDKNIEQRICLKFCIANGISCAESLKTLQKAYGESPSSNTRAYEWYSEFKSGRDVVEDLPRSGWKSTSSTELNVLKVKEVVTENHHLSLREIAAELSVSHESIHTISNDFLGMKRVGARLVLEELNFLQKLNRIKAKVSTNIIVQPLYSPNMAPANLFLFPKLKLPLQGTRFQSIEGRKEKSRREPKSIPENAFKKCFDEWIIRWHNFIISGGFHFEGDKINGMSYPTRLAKTKVNFVIKLKIFIYLSKSISSFSK